MSFLFVLGGLIVWLFFNGAFTSLGTRWSSHTMATQYWNWYFISVSSVCLWAVPKKSMKPLTFVSWDFVFCLSLSLLQLPTCLACLQCHRMAQILTLGKISPKPFYLLPTANTYTQYVWHNKFNMFDGWVFTDFYYQDTAALALLHVQLNFANALLKCFRIENVKH